MYLNPAQNSTDSNQSVRENVNSSSVNIPTIDSIQNGIATLQLNESATASVNSVTENHLSSTTPPPDSGLFRTTTAEEIKLSYQKFWGNLDVNLQPETQLALRNEFVENLYATAQSSKDKLGQDAAQSLSMLVEFLIGRPVLSNNIPYSSTLGLNASMRLCELVEAESASIIAIDPKILLGEIFDRFITLCERNTFTELHLRLVLKVVLVISKVCETNDAIPYYSRILPLLETRSFATDELKKDAQSLIQFIYRSSSEGKEQIENLVHKLTQKINEINPLPYKFSNDEALCERCRDMIILCLPSLSQKNFSYNRPLNNQHSRNIMHVVWRLQGLPSRI